ncbi:unnamed protein product [Orchesella dallaii]|uniref:Corticotropin-releasing factor domain-containing protein n=1 Tax=Orchesella dallaii TaxID=48710 RepID=A0ABP1PNI0_9HEXA
MTVNAVKVVPETSNFEKVQNFNFFSLCPTLTGNSQHISQTRISPPSAKNQFPTKSLICRTMTVGQLPEGVSATFIKTFTNNTSSNSDQQIRPTQNNQSSISDSTTDTNYSENSFKLSSTTAATGAVVLQQNCEAEKMPKIYHKAADMIGKSSRFARFLGDGGLLSRRSSDSCSQHLTSSSLPIRPIKSYYHPNGHWEYGMILIVLFLLSTFSTSTMVSCVPLGQSGVGGGDDDGAIPSSMEESGGLMSNSRILGVKPQNQNQPSDSTISYSVQPKGQLFLPSLLSKNPSQSFNGRGREGGVVEERGDNDQQSRTTSNFLRFHNHPDQSTFTAGENHFQREPIQKRKRRNSGMGPSLSIVNPLDVLRQRLLLEIARRKMRQSHNQIIANEEILRKIGRRR